MEKRIKMLEKDYSLKNEPFKWLIYSEGKGRFPYKLYIEEEPGKFLYLRAHDRWPGPGKNIFCELEGEVTERKLPKKEPLESCDIISIRRYGKKLNVLLDRSKRKRCWFIFLKKQYKDRPGEYYDQVFWITQSSAIASRRGAYIPQSGKQDTFKVAIDTAERYPYRFGKAEVEKKELPVGDYGLLYNGSIVAIAERKTKDNFLHEISSFDVLRAKLEELSRFPHKAVVFESSYLDFVDPKKNRFYSATFIAKVLADLSVQFPQIQFIFSNNRKSANKWLYHWFSRIYQEKSLSAVTKASDEK